MRCQDKTTTINSNDPALLAALMEMSKTMKAMDERMESMQTKLNKVEKISAKSGKVAEHFDKFYEPVAWCTDKLDQIRSFKGPMLGWTPWGRVNMNALEDAKKTKSGNGDPEKDDGNITDYEEDDESEAENEDDALLKFDRKTIEEVN